MTLPLKFEEFVSTVR